MGQQTFMMNMMPAPAITQPTMLASRLPPPPVLAPALEPEPILGYMEDILSLQAFQEACSASKESPPVGLATSTRPAHARSTIGHISSPGTKGAMGALGEAAIASESEVL
ncbi:hypothetical protein EOD39_21588 [Acipenser ruthenus]|uniref:Uncharacterized protein n=1 Tax=Acipenser ruthenus TaxID=7906 RepID=A0A444US93_ACIRT|nr:hypothetical protein EOD39_21588 [Acipenser ruthenus]